MIKKFVRWQLNVYCKCEAGVFLPPKQNFVYSFLMQMYKKKFGKLKIISRTKKVLNELTFCKDLFWSILSAMDVLVFMEQLWWNLWGSSRIKEESVHEWWNKGDWVSRVKHHFQKLQFTWEIVDVFNNKNEGLSIILETDGVILLLGFWCFFIHF